MIGHDSTDRQHPWGGQSKSAVSLGVQTCEQSSAAGESVSSAYRNEWHIQPQRRDESESWLLTYLDTVTLLLVFMLVMVTLSGQGVGTKKTTDIMPAQSGLLQQECVSLTGRSGIAGQLSEGVLVRPDRGDNVAKGLVWKAWERM